MTTEQLDTLIKQIKMSDRNLIVTSMEIEGSKGANAAIACMEGSVYGIINLLVSAAKESTHIKIAIVAAAALIVAQQESK